MVELGFKIAQHSEARKAFETARDRMITSLDGLASTLSADADDRVPARRAIEHVAIRLKSLSYEQFAPSSVSRLYNLPFGDQPISTTGQTESANPYGGMKNSPIIVTDALGLHGRCYYWCYRNWWNFGMPLFDCARFRFRCTNCQVCPAFWFMAVLAVDPNNPPGLGTFATFDCSFTGA
jgi:hypothetical protein